MLGPKKKYPGQNMHLEYHTVNRKKEKPADCIYMTDNRECQCRECPYFLSKCFVASACRYRVKSTDAAANPSATKPASSSPVVEANDRKYKGIACTLPLRCRVWSSDYGEGAYVGFEYEDRLIRVRFEDRVRSFKYPESFFNKTIRVTTKNFEIVLADRNRLYGKRGR